MGASSVVLFNALARGGWDLVLSTAKLCYCFPRQSIEFIASFVRLNLSVLVARVDGRAGRDVTTTQQAAGAVVVT